MKRPPPVFPIKGMIGGGLFFAASLAMPGMAAQADGMTVAEFLAKADVLRTGGPEALESPDIRLLRAEMTAVTQDYRAAIARQQADGTPPHSCPPPKGRLGLGSNELIREFRAIPVAQRGMGIRAAFHALMARRFPCGGSAHQPHAEQHQQEE